MLQCVNLTLLKQTLKVMRTICNICSYPTKVCVCSSVAQVNCEPDLLVIQHYKEQGHAKNTVRLAKLCIENLHVSTIKTDNDLLGIVNKLKGKTVAIFYPTKCSLDLQKHSETFKKSHYDTLIFIDGTWKQASGIVGKLTANFKELHEFDFWKFGAGHRNEYTIRKSPNVSSLSTLEAIAKTLEDGLNIDATPLYDVFNRYQMLWKSYQ